MLTGQRTFHRTLAALLSIVALAGSGWAQSIPERVPLPLEVRKGHCECVLPAIRADDKYCLIVGSLAEEAGPYPVRVSTESTTERVHLPQAEELHDRAWHERTQAARAEGERARTRRAPPEEYPPAASPPRQRCFSLFAGDGDFQQGDGYVRITANLRKVGRHCQVYVDRDHTGSEPLQPTIDDIVATFDSIVFPWGRQHLGHCTDVDRDGRFTILLTGWLGRLRGGKVSVGGFVRGSDFYRDMAAPYGNRCDMMYLNTDLRPGPHLRTLLAHEYTHAIVFSEHVLGQFPAPVPRQDEESWLNEAIAHVVESQQGHGWSNLDYRVSAFLNAPHRHPLVVADAYRDGLWRNPGHRGAIFLFLRWCLDNSGEDLLPRLAQTHQRGIANLETATQSRFAELFRQWTVQLALPPTRPEPADLTNFPKPRGPYSPLGTRLLCGPRFRELALTGERQDMTVAGTSAAYWLLHSHGGSNTRLVVEADPDAQLQVTLIRLPARTARLSLHAHQATEDGSLRLGLTARDSKVRLQAVVWERLHVTASRPEDTSFRIDQTAAQVASWFGHPELAAGETRLSQPVPLPRSANPGEPFIVKVMGEDAAGHTITAWLTVTR